MSADKVFVVTSGRYSDYDIVAVFSSGPRAQAFIDEHHADDRDARIESYDLDPTMHKPSDRLHPYHVTMFRDGTSEVSAVDYDVLSDRITDDFEPFCWAIRQQSAITGYVLAENEQHAVKIVSEKRAMLIAGGQWPSDNDPCWRRK